MTDWQVGDLAVCVDDAWRPSMPKLPPSGQLKAGRLYQVARVRTLSSGPTNLLMEGCVYKNGFGWRADRFRKIRPDELEECEAEFVTLLKRSKRTVRA